MSGSWQFRSWSTSPSAMALVVSARICMTRMLSRSTIIWNERDFLYSRSFQMMVDLDSMRVMQILADTTNAIAEGEVLQLLNCHDPDIPEQRYMDVIERKTA